MCGITGSFSIGGAPPIADETLRRMTASLAHRGPDDDGFYQDADVALGFRRLSIIDLTSGHQPIHNETKSVWTILNGEIYNYRELRQTLAVKGHRFYTDTDTEVLVHLYEDLGDAMVHELRGMFAFCIWDARAKRLFLARDHLGVKPLFYLQGGMQFLFASEIKSILASGLADRAIDPEALNHYLGLQYIPGPMTIYRSIKKLPAGHTLAITKGGEPQVRQYWDIASISEAPGSLEDQMEAYEQVFMESVRLQMRSDVPVGAFLSGGVDSSAVVAAMSKLSTTPVSTFTICHTDPAYDEAAAAGMIAARFGTHHRTLRIGVDDFLRLLPGAIDQYDEPFGDSSALPTVLVSRLAREHVKVVLSGDGSDETCGGYSRYVTLARLRRLRRGLPLLRLLPRGMRGLPGQASGGIEGVGVRLRKALYLLGETDLERHYYFMSYFRASKFALYGPALTRSLSRDADLDLFRSHCKRVADKNWLQQILYLDINTYLVDDILYKVDIASMAASLEVRVPFLDHKLVEVAAAIPAKYKVAHGVGKVFLKRLLQRWLPFETLYRQKKGFEIPVSAWFRNELAPFIRETLLSSTLLTEPYFNRAAIAELLDDHQAGLADRGPQLWTLMALELWHRKSGGTISG